MNRTTNSDDGDEFSRNDKLSFYRSDELSDDGDEFYSEKTILLPLSRLVSYSMFLSFSRHQIPPKDETPNLQKGSLPLLTEFCFSKKKSSRSKVGDSYIYLQESSRGLYFHPNCIR